MPAREDEEVGEGDDAGGVPLVARVDEGHVPQGQAVMGERPGEGLRHFVVEGGVAGVGADDDGAGVGLPARGEAIDEAVARIENAGEADALRDVVVAGTAGQEKVHGRCLLVS